MFDEIKIKRILKKPLDKDSYSKLSNRIKKDKRIIKHLIEDSPSNIGILDDDIDVLEYIEENYELLKYLNSEQLNRVFKSLDYSKVKIDLEFFNKLTEKNKIILFKKYPIVCINLFDNGTRIKLILEIIITTVDNTFKSEFTNILTKEELDKIIFELSGESLIYILENSELGREYICDFLKDLSLEKIFILYERCRKIFDYLPDDIKDMISIKNAKGDIGKILLLNSSARIKMALEDSRLLMFLSDDEIDEYIRLSKPITVDEACYFRENAKKTDVLNMSEEEAFKYISSDFIHMFFYFQYSRCDYSKVKNLMFARFDKLDDKNKANKLKDLYLSLSEEPFIKGESYIYKNELFQISKLLFDYNIVNNNDISLIEKYKNTKDRNLLIEIISNAYGHHVRNIFEKRPRLNIDNIDSFVIFDKDIYEVLGDSFINFSITYSLHNCYYLIYEMAEDKSLLISFKKYFDLVSEDYDNININFMYNIMDKFMIYKNILKNIDYDNIDEKTRKNIKLLINDSLLPVIYINSKEDIKNYDSIRNKSYCDYIDKVDSVVELKNMIFSYITNRDIPNGEHGYSVENLSIQAFFKAFNINYVLENEELINDIGLSKDDVAILLLLNKVLHTYDIEVLKDTFKAIVSNNLDYSLARTTVGKITKYCSDSVKNSILTQEKLANMPHREKDGITIIELESEPFSALISITGLNISSGTHYIKPPQGEFLLDDWLNKEDGYSHISTSLVSSDTSIYPLCEDVYKEVSGYITFIFDSDVDIQGMGTSDISSSHQKRSMHYFNFIMNNEFGYLPVDEFKRRLNDKKVSGLERGKFQNEISISRYKEDIRRKDSGRRVMPIGIYVVGEITDEILKTAKVFDEYYQKHNLGRFMIIKVNPKTYRGRGKIEKNEKGENTNGYNR